MSYAWEKPVGALASSTFGTAVASKAIDSNYDTKWRSEYDGVGGWIRFDLGTLKFVSQIEIRHETTDFSYYYPQTIRIETSENGTDWTTAIESFNLSVAEGAPIASFSPVLARYIRLYYKQITAGNPTYPNWAYADVIEFSAYVLEDNTFPTISFNPTSRDWDSADINVTVTAIDNESGIKSVEYTWSKETTTPASWVTFTNGSTLTQADIGEWYLHIKATDNIDHVTTTYSGLYKLVKDFKVWNGTSFVNPVQPLQVYQAGTWKTAEVFVYQNSTFVKKF